MKYNKVTYYTIKCEKNEKSQAEDFFYRLSKDFKNINQIEQFAIWLERVGNSRNGLEYDFLRFEDKCFAIPPRKLKTQNGKKIELRLYCYWINERIVILFNGDKKTTDKAHDCPNVRFTFLQAQIWTKQLIEAKIENDGVKI